jgi:hypothetical protein
MRSFVIAAMAASVLSGAAVTSAGAAPLHRHGNLTAWERAAIARSAHDLDVLRRHVRADGKVSIWERVRLNLAQTRHNALVARYRHN